MLFADNSNPVVNRVLVRLGLAYLSVCALGTVAFEIFIVLLVISDLF